MAWAASNWTGSTLLRSITCMDVKEAFMWPLRNLHRITWLRKPAALAKAARFASRPSSISVFVWGNSKLYCVDRSLGAGQRLLKLLDEMDVVPAQAPSID